MPCYKSDFSWQLRYSVVAVSPVIFVRVMVYPNADPFIKGEDATRVISGVLLKSVKKDIDVSRYGRKCPHHITS